VLDACVVLCDVISAVAEFMGMACSVAAWFIVMRDVIRAATEFMINGLQCCGMVYGVV
jgi:hypothetical protein